MTLEEFSNKYDNEETSSIFDDTCEFFSQELPQEFFDDYDPVDVILDTMGHQDDAKNFDNVIKFIDIVKNRQPELYKESFVYLNDFLVEYYFFHQDTSKVEEAMSLYIDNPLEDYDSYLKAYRTLIFYQHSELLNKAIEKNYDDVSVSNQIIGGAYDLAISKFYMTLQETFEDKNEAFDKVDFSSKVEKYEFELDDNLLSALQKSISQSQLSVKALNALFVEDRVSSIVILRGYFLRYMHERGFEFYLSGHIWDKMLEHWEENKKKAKSFDSYFRVTTASFEKYLVGFSDMFVSNKPEMIATLWGSVYIYDFLHQLEIIPTEVYEDFLKTSQNLKGTLIGIYTPDLWRSNFVHQWMKPDSVSDNEFKEEHNIFTKSISIKYEDFSVTREELSDELSKIGPLADYIIKGGESRMIKDDFSFFDKLFKDNAGIYDDEEDIYDDEEDIYDDEEDIYDDEEEYIPFEEKYLEPVRREPKVGRNDPCTCGSGKKYKKCCGKE